MNPVGIFDSGLGGLSVLQAVRDRLPHEHLLYLADSGFAPYGDKPDAYVEERSVWIGARLVAQGVKAIVVACNTATAIAARTLRERYPDLPIVGVEPGLKPAVEVTHSNVVGVLATASTLASERYAKLMQRVQDAAPHVRFISQPGRGWVEHVEAGELSGNAVERSVSQVLAPLLDQGTDTLVLGCTHYAFLAPILHKIAPKANIVDTAPAIARQLARRLEEENALNPHHVVASLTLQTTGDTDTLEQFVRRLGIHTLGHGSGHDAEVTFAKN